MNRKTGFRKLLSLVVHSYHTVMLVLLATSSLAGQNNPVRDASAIAALQSSLASMGGIIGVDSHSRLDDDGQRIRK